MSDRSSAGERAATASTAAERSIRMRLASSARAAARRISGRPAPASTASVIAANAPRSGVRDPPRSALSANSFTRYGSEEPRPLEDDQRAEHHAAADEGSQHVERQDHGRDALDRSAVRGHGWDHQQQDEGDEPEHPTAGGDYVCDR